MTRFRALLFATFLAGAAAWPSLARADGPPATAATATAPAATPAPDQEGFFSLSVNTVDQGEVFAVLRGDDVLMSRGDLENAGLRGFTATEVSAGGRSLVSLASVRPALRFTVDVQDVAIRVRAPVELLPSQHVDVGAPPADISYFRRASAFFNYAPNVTVSSQGPASAGGFFEGGVSEENRLWYSGLYASTQTGVARGLTNLTFDDRPKMVRLTVGDTNVSTGAIGGAAIMGGLTFARDFSENPYFIRFPSMRFTSTTLVPADVDVYVNGIRVKSVPISPGTFTLDGVRGLVGAGNITYILHDALGGQQLYTMPYYVGPAVFAKGVSDFAFSVGFPRDGLGTESFDYEGPAFMGYYQLGATDTVTLGARAEGRWATLSGGPYVAVTTPAGIFSLEGGASVASDGGAEPGAAGVFSYSYLGRRFNAGGSLRAQSDSYANVTLSPEMDRSLFQASTFTSVPAGRGASIGTQFAVDVHRDVPPIASVGLFSQVQIAPDLALLAQATLATLAPPKSEIDGFLLLAWAPDVKFNATAGAVSNASVPGASLQVTKSSTFGEDWSLAAATTISANETDVSVNHRLQTATNVVSTYFDWLGKSATLSVEPAGSVIYVAGAGTFLSRPVYDSFALVRVPGVKDVRVYLNAQEVGKTDENGNLLVPSLISYYGSQVKIATEDVPLSYTLDRDTIVAAPPRRGAAYVEFAAASVQYFRGRVLIVGKQDGKEVERIPAYGDLVVKNGLHDATSPLGADGDFELESLKPGPHDAEIRHKSGNCRFRIEVGEATVPLVDLGVLRCYEK